MVREMTNGNDHQTIIIRFPELSDVEAGRAAQRLKKFILAAQDEEAAGTLSLSLQRGKDDSQSTGDILNILFSSGTLIAIAGGIRAYLAAVGSKLVIETPEGKVIASGDAAKSIDVPGALAMLKQKQGNRRLAAKTEANGPDKPDKAPRTIAAPSTAKKSDGSTKPRKRR